MAIVGPRTALAEHLLDHSPAAGVLPRKARCGGRALSVLLLMPMLVAGPGLFAILVRGWSGQEPGITMAWSTPTGRNAQQLRLPLSPGKARQATNSVGHILAPLSPGRAGHVAQPLRVRQTAAGASLGGGGGGGMRGPVVTAGSGGAAVEQAPVAEVLSLLEGCQTYFKDKLEKLRWGDKPAPTFGPVSWERNDGKNGGGTRFQTSTEDGIFNVATINWSGVDYTNNPKAPIDSASALSVILHPRNPYAPSMHFHMSYVEVRNGQPYWRMIADLNPAIEDPAGTAEFEKTLQSVVPGDLYRDGKAFGDKYFYIPSLGRTRGVSHMFLAKLEPGKELSPQECLEMARKLAESAIGVYCDLVQAAMDEHSEVSIAADSRQEQLAYHTTYFFQVLLYDHGTTTGLLAHNDNDVGTLGSLPQKVDGKLLNSWMAKLSPPQDDLLKRILAVLPEHGEGVSTISSEVRGSLADVVRSYYKEDLARTSLQGSFDMNWWASMTASRLASEAS